MTIHSFFFLFGGGKPKKQKNLFYFHFCSWHYLKENWPEISQPIALLVNGIILWVLGRILIPDHMNIGGVPTRMICLFVGAQICGVFLRILQWPEMLGMLGFGIIYANIGLANFDGFNEFEIFFR